VAAPGDLLFRLLFQLLSNVIQLECVRLTVLESGMMDPEEISHFNDTCPGEGVVRYMVNLGAPLDDWITIAAAAEGQLELLRYALANGACWLAKVVHLVDVMMSDRGYNHDHSSRPN
jgi:hypothetical protein